MTDDVIDILHLQARGFDKTVTALSGTPDSSAWRFNFNFSKNGLG